MEENENIIYQNPQDAQLTEEEKEQQEVLQQQKNDEREAIEALKKFTEEGDDDEVDEISLRSILGGDILQSRFIRNQIFFIMFCVLLTLLYTGNRYSSQQDAITIDSLRTELQKVKYNVLTQSSELMNVSRQSNVELRLRQTKDSVLEIPITPPYLIPSDSVLEALAE